MEIKEITSIEDSKSKQDYEVINDIGVEKKTKTMNEKEVVKD